MRVLDLTIKDIKQVTRDWKSALFLVVMPILFTLFFGFILGGVYDVARPSIPVCRWGSSTRILVGSLVLS